MCQRLITGIRFYKLINSIQIKKHIFIWLSAIGVNYLSAQVNHDSIARLADTIRSIPERMDFISSAYNKKLLSNREINTVTEQLIELGSSSGSKNDLARAYLAVGYILNGQRKFESEINYTFKALHIAEEIHDTLLIIKSNYNLGSDYVEMKNMQYAKKHFSFSINYFNNSSDKEVERYKSNCYNQLGTIYKEQSILDSALFYHKKAMQIRLGLGNRKLIAASYNNLGLVYKKKKDYDNALLYLKKSLSIKKKINDKKGEAGTSINIGNILKEKGFYQEAIEYLQIGTKMAHDIHEGSFYENGIDGLASCYYAMGDFKNSAREYSRYKVVKDSLLQTGITKQITELTAQYDSDKKDSELSLQEEKLKNQRSEIKKQKLFSISVVCVLGLVLLLIFFIYRSFRINKKNSIILERKNIIIEHKNKEITDSINYAQRIQNSLLTSNSVLEQILPEHFILYKPKDIVSGDFYWFYQVTEENRTACLIAAADCTGHGVPGAFMSLIGKEKLDKAASVSSSPSQILSYLNVNVKNALQQNSGQLTRDGMDIALIKLETNESGALLKYAGANRPLWIIRKGQKEIEEIKATKQAIAGFTLDDQVFEEHCLTLQKGDTFYIFSDGYADQFGGAKQKKLTTRSFKNLLISQQGKKMQEQKLYYSEFIYHWMENHEQIDDILLMGIRI